MPKPYTSRAEYYYGALTEGYSGDLPRPQSREDYYLLKLIEKMNQSQGQTVFTPKGTVQNVAALPSLSDATAGDIYNIKVDSKTTSDFVEGTGVTIKGGSNVYCVLDDNDQKKWDCLGTTYAVDYALDPSSGSPIANNAVCAAIDNVVDQLNPVIVNQTKRVHIPELLDGQCCKILDIDGNFGTFGVVILDFETVTINEPDHRPCRIVLTNSHKPIFMTQTMDNFTFGVVYDKHLPKSLYIISERSSEIYFDMHARVCNYCETALSAPLSPKLIEEPSIVETNSITFDYTGMTAVRKFIPMPDSEATGGATAYRWPSGGYLSINMKNVTCSAGDGVAIYDAAADTGGSGWMFTDEIHTCYDPNTLKTYHFIVALVTNGSSLTTGILMLDACTGANLVGTCPITIQYSA